MTQRQIDLFTYLMMEGADTTAPEDMEQLEIDTQRHVERLTDLQALQELNTACGVEDSPSEDLRVTLEGLDSDVSRHIELLEDLINKHDIAPECDEAQDMIDLLEEIRGVINA